MIFFKKYKINALLKKLRAMRATRLHNPVKDEVLIKELMLYLKLAAIYHALIGHKKYPYAELQYWECIRAAARLDHAPSQFKLGQYLVEKAKYREKLEKNDLFANPSNAKQAASLFEEGLAYLQAAENMNHIMARRYRGLCYINGWGVPVDKDAGFNLVVESIDRENAWDKVAQIFADIGLNKPEFFSELAKKRKNI